MVDVITHHARDAFQRIRPPNYAENNDPNVESWNAHALRRQITDPHRRKIIAKEKENKVNFG